MDFVALTIEILNKLAHFAGSYGMAIIIFTILMRLCLWHVNVSQQRSMKNMQNLTPKMKMIQEKYKNNPEQMQKKMMEFYKEHNFNPTAGCLPMLIQIPIFIMLYSALMSPQFIQMAGNTNFLFINRLDATIKSNAGVSLDGKFSVSKNAQFQAGKSAIVYIDNEKIDNVKIQKPQKAIEIQGEIEKAQNGQETSIFLKMNSLTDRQLIDALKDASQAGVKIKMIIRGICCILPGIKGKTENIEVISVVGRFLEHSRVYCFGTGDEMKMYISSADWMTRNTENRVEIAAPIYDRKIKESIYDTLCIMWKDNLKARILQSNGTYKKPEIKEGDELLDCQNYLRHEYKVGRRITLHREINKE